MIGNGQAIVGGGVVSYSTAKLLLQRIVAHDIAVVIISKPCRYSNKIEHAMQPQTKWRPEKGLEVTV